MSALGGWKSERGSAATEFALTLPMMLVLMFGGMEAGHFVWTQHKLAEAVRDGARYAARIPIREICHGTTEVMTVGTENQVKLLTRTGQVANADANPRVPGWTDAEVSVEPNCDNTAFVDTGLYAEYEAAYPGAKGPVIVVAAQGVQYPWMFNMLGSVMSGISGDDDGDPLGLALSASSNSPGIGL